MKTTIYFVEDEQAMNAYIVDARQAERFANCTLCLTRSVRDCIGWAKANAMVPTLFIMDSRLHLDAGTRELARQVLLEHGVDYDLFCKHLQDLRVTPDILTGALGGMILTTIHKKCRLLMVTAFKDQIAEVCARFVAFDELMKATFSRVMSKGESDAAGLDLVIIESLTRLRREP